MRNAKRLKAIRLLPCVRCGQSPSQAAHSNSSKHGKGRGIKSSESLDAPAKDNGYAVKAILIDGHTVPLGTDACFYHPDTRVLYTVV